MSKGKNLKQLFSLINPSNFSAVVAIAHLDIYGWKFTSYIENNTWSRGDMEFIFECSHRYRTSERSRFPTTFRRFPKIFPNLSEGQTNVSELSPNIFRRLPKIAEDCRRLPRKN